MISFNRLYVMIFGFTIGTIIGGLWFGGAYANTVTLLIMFGLYLKFIEWMEKPKGLQVIGIDEQIDAKLGTYKNPDESTYKEVVINKNKLTTED